MVAPQMTACATVEIRPVLGHVNLMVDTFIANANVDDLRAIARSLLATNPPNFAIAFTTAARYRLNQTTARVVINHLNFFVRQPGTKFTLPTGHLQEVLAHARTLYGAGMGFESLKVLALIVHASIGLQWEDDSDMASVLAFIDADIGQAIQSSKEEIEGGRVTAREIAYQIVNDLRAALDASLADVDAWGGEFPFERASYSLKYWKVREALAAPTEDA